MSIINHLSSWVPAPLIALPFNASQISHAATFIGGIALTSFCYGSPLTALASGLTALASYGVSKVKEVQEKQAEDKKLSEKFTHKFLDLLKKCVTHPANKKTESNDNGFTEKNIHKMLGVIELLEEHHYCEGTHDPEHHASLRDAFVGLQGASEHLMSISKLIENISSVNIVFHVSSPITPLCQPISDQELTALQHIPATADEMMTVKKRTFTCRQLLSQDNVKAHVEYPLGGKSSRKPEELKVYRKSCRKFKDSLVDHELTGLEKMESQKIGATYVLKTLTGQHVVISIQISQIIDVNQSGPVALYVGPSESPPIKERVEVISDYLVTRGGTDIRKFTRAA